MTNTTDHHGSRLAHFAAEMKRRHVVRFALGYAAVAFVLLQLAEIVLPAFGIGETVLRILVVAAALLFPPALVMAWIFDVTARGIERTERTPESRTGLIPQLALLGVTLAVMLGVGAWLVREGVLDDPVVPGAAPGPEEPALVAYQPGAPIRSLAVLPLDDFSGSPEQGYFSAGMQEELIAQLSQLPGLRVVSRTSVQRFAGADASIPRIGRELQVDAVIEGSVRRSGDQVRITVQLIHAASDTHLWTQQYDRALEDVLALQSEVALDIARQIQAELSPEDTEVLQRVASRSIDPDAQDAYLRGRYEAEKGTPEGLQTARDLFQTAVQQDSSYAPALARLAGTRVLLGLADSALTARELTLAEEEAERALAMDSASQEAKEVLSLIRQTFPAAGTGHVAVVPAVPTTPGMDTAWFQTLTGLGRQIEEQMRFRSASASQAGTMGRFVGARGLMAAGRWDDAVEMLSEVVEADPDLGPAWDLLARARMSAGDPGGAVDVLEAWSRRGGRGAPAADEVRELRQAVSEEGARGYWSWQKEHLEALVAAGEPVPPLDLAAARAGAGDVEGAFQALDHAVAQHDRGLALLQHDPVWDVLRADPRFADVVRRTRVIRVQQASPPPRPPRGR